MNERQIDCFLAVARLGSFSAAAQALYISQPAVSYQIRSLEKELNVLLLYRAPQQCALTAAGKAFLPEAQRLDEAFRGARQRMAALAGGETALVLGCPQFMLRANENALFEIVRRAESLSAPIRIESRELAAPPAHAEQLRDGVVDLMLSDIDLPEVSLQSMARRFLFVSGAYACMHEGHPHAGSRLTCADLDGEHLLLYDDRTAFLSGIRERIARSGAHVDVQTYDSFAQAIAYLRPDRGVSFFPCPLPVGAPVRYVPLALDPPIRIGLVWLRQRETDPLRRLIQTILSMPAQTWNSPAGI